MGKPDTRGHDHDSAAPLGCSDPACRDPALYWLILGCTRNLHVTGFPACLAHMIAVRATYFDDRRNLWCGACYHKPTSDKALMTVDAILITDLAGVITTEDSREAGILEWIASIAPQ